MDGDNSSALLEGSNCIARVLHRLKSGKEADVYCCEAQAYLGVDMLAAKVYRPLESRGFRNDSIYQQGRFIKDARLRRAYQNKSRAGRHIQNNLWVSAEYETLKLLHAAGARVPIPYETVGSTVIMEYIGTRDQPAPTLNRVNLCKEEAQRISQEIVEQVRLWFSCGRIHADLSPYNILCQDGAVTIIDFPQAIDPEQNPAAFSLLLRDLERVAESFKKYDLAIDPFQTARSIWNANSRWRI
jgi:RIO kinase 1